MALQNLGRPALHYNAALPRNEGQTVSDTFLDRLRSNRLTNVEQYRRMKKSAENSNAAPRNTGTDWKNWQLAPVSAGLQGKVKSKQASDGAEQVQRALQKLDA